MDGHLFATDYGLRTTDFVCWSNGRDRSGNDHIAAGAFRLVQFLIGLTNQFQRSERFGAVGCGHAKADGDMKRLFLEDEGVFLHHDADAFGDIESSLQRALREDHDKLLAAVAGKEFFLSYNRLDTRGQLAQGKV